VFSLYEQNIVLGCRVLIGSRKEVNHVLKYLCGLENLTNGTGGETDLSKEVSQVIIIRSGNVSLTLSKIWRK
jgi:hypothetical protein